MFLWKHSFENCSPRAKSFIGMFQDKLRAVVQPVSQSYRSSLCSVTEHGLTVQEGVEAAMHVITLSEILTLPGGFQSNQNSEPGKSGIMLFD